MKKFCGNGGIICEYKSIHRIRIVFQYIYIPICEHPLNKYKKTHISDVKCPIRNLKNNIK